MLPTCEIGLNGIYLEYILGGTMETAKLFKNGKSQAVRLPKEFRFRGDSVFIRRIGEAVILLPQNYGWDSMFNALKQFSPDFMDERNQPETEQREEL